ncbi:m110L [Myxoma virus]|uniref:M110L n=1 Tax=Myxoma virus TaxID=10273 RepID=A0A481NGV3_9POXV|nr:m110L [Myxoma virus]QAV37296.1 m110L [Myxoma virus]QAV39155.1 m110L [Myxoma virus]QAV39324.1 m110L [Myxoma virus]QAV39831.1 m110L [Myxoma virus]
MITLFLVLCYFILIFNIIVPAISEKMRKEYDAYLKYAHLKKDAVCVNDRLFTYDFKTSGVVAKMFIDSNGKPLPCSRTRDIRSNNAIYCDNDENVLDFRKSCSKAYLDLFFTT